MSLTNMKITLLPTLLFFTSCATGGHIRDSDPTRVEIIQKDYKYLANCVVEKIDASGVARETRVITNEQQRQVRVFEPFGFIHDTKTFEFLFIEMKENQTKVKSYGFETLVGREHYPNQIWPFVLECGDLENPQALLFEVPHFLVSQ